MSNKVLIVVGAIWIATSVTFLVLYEQEIDPVITPLTESWEMVVPHQQIPDGLNSLSAEDCGMCHKAHYEEWKTSTHAQAWNDMQFQSELDKETSPFFCINCHVPLQNQQEYIVDGYIDGDLYNPHKRKNELFDPYLQKEGVTCVACHLRNNAIVGPTGTNKAPHETVKDPEFLSESLCLRCHNAVADITPELSCSFETGDEWETGPYKATKNCISCHMKELNREIVSGNGIRKSHLHYFSGSGIPKHDTLKTTMLNGLVFNPQELKSKFNVQEYLTFSMRIKNENAGHKVPTGNPERFILVSFKVITENGEIVKQSEYRIGEKWEWYPVAKKISDNNLRPLEERTFDFDWKNLTIGKYTLVVEVTKHRMDKKTATFNKLSEHYPLSVTAFKREFPFSVH